MSRLKRDQAVRKLRQLLASAPEDRFFEMCWSLNATLTEPHPNAERLLNYPPDSVGGGYGSKYAVHPWEIETLISERLLAPATALYPDKPNRVLDCSSYNAAARVVNALRDLEAIDDANSLRRSARCYSCYFATVS